MDNIIYSAFFLVYALATVPLIRKLTTSVKQTWYADDAAATGKISDLHVWWDEITHLGPSYGYYANASKTCLVIKKEIQSDADAIFGDTQVKITSEGCPYLLATISKCWMIS